ncbi:hypothetical protein [Rhizobium skierniewicense]|uniref:hypothetical protein n=1 Tax=Rhizobium skierniewicense TaxID=984260 RepID=UPI00157450B4|nr:hypothetical protein [Rhizobium skierniewicense]NTF32318.1 hypothetical protein [Rhizobium skierniewicense]
MKIGIENLLKWAFTQELCENRERSGEAIGSSNFTMIMEIVRLGAVIDRSRNIMEASSAFVALEPHEDALAVIAAVRNLAKHDFDIGEGWNPFPEWEDDLGLIAMSVRDEVEVLRARGETTNGRHVAALVFSCAVLGRGPDWHAERPEQVYVKRGGKEAWFVQKAGKDAFGRSYSFEANGYDAKRKRPIRGAYRKMELSQSIRGAMIARLEWQLWQDALCELHKTLENQLVSHDLLPFHPHRQPWMDFRDVRENLVSV